MAWLVSAPARRHISVHLDLARAMQAAAELHGTVEGLLRESDVAAELAELRARLERTRRTLHGED